MCPAPRRKSRGLIGDIRDRSADRGHQWSENGDLGSRHCVSAMGTHEITGAVVKIN